MKSNVTTILGFGLIILATLCFSSVSQAQSTKTTLEDRIPAFIKNEKRSFFTLTVENDLFGSGRDENYTSGVRLTYFSDRAITPKLVEQASNFVPFFKFNNTTNIYYSLGHNLYTPKNIERTNPDPDDRPYAGFLYGSVGYSTLSKNHIEDAEVTFGVVGPAALGETTQKTVHDLINSKDPRGWDSQLKNEPALILAYQRTWPAAYAVTFDPFFIRVAPHAGLALGNIYTYAATGVTFQLVPEKHKWQTPPARVRPAIPGSGFFATPNDEFSWSLFAGVEGRAMARNIFLDGNTFRDSPDVDKKYGVLDVNAGLTLTYGRAQIAYTLNWRSDEFHGPSDNSLFGSISFGFRF